MKAIIATHELYGEGGSCEEQSQIEKKEEVSERRERKTNCRKLRRE